MRLFPRLRLRNTGTNFSAETNSEEPFHDVCGIILNHLKMARVGCLHDRGGWRKEIILAASYVRLHMTWPRVCPLMPAKTPIRGLDPIVAN
jgi:hypothetical protein